MEDTAPEVSTSQIVDLVEARSAHNYHPLPVAIAAAQGAWVTDIAGRRYLDCLAGYSALNFGHGHPEILAAAHRQLDLVTLTSRSFLHDQLGPFCAELADLAGMDMVLPMNTGAEAVESGIKVARKWGYDVKGVPDGTANIVVAEGNFHGRTTTIVGFSTDPLARRGFGPYGPGFRIVPYGDLAAVEAAIDDATVGVLIEPVQGEAGVIVPPTFACEHENVRPDMYLLGKALGGGVVPVSAVIADREVLGVLHPGEHGSTFGGNPLACAVGRAVIRLLRTGEYQRRAAELGQRLQGRLGALVGHGVVEVRGLGLWAGIDIDPALASGREVCELLMQRGVLAKDTHGSTIRLGPPLVVTPQDLDWAVDMLADALAELRSGVRATGQ